MRRLGLGFVRAAVVVALVVTSSVVFGAAPATADEPTIAVTPSTGLRDGEYVYTEVTGFTDEDGFFLIFQCDASIELPTGMETLGQVCSTDGALQYGGTEPVRRWVTIHEMVGPTTDPGDPAAVHCGGVPGDCLLVAWSLTTGRYAAAPIDVVPTPLRLFPNYAVGGESIDVLVRGEPRDEVTVAQCVLPVGTTLAGSRCGPTTDLTLGGKGRAVTSFVLQENLTTAEGTFGCYYSLCAIGSFDRTGALVASEPVHVGQSNPLVITVSPLGLDDLADGQVVEVTATGEPQLPLTVAQCDTSVPWHTNVEDGPCLVLAELGAAEPPVNVRTASVPVHRSFTGADGTFVHCNGGGPTERDCLVVVQPTGGGEFTPFWLSFRMHTTATMTPSTGLLDGELVSIEGSDLGDVDEVRLVVCEGLDGPAAPAPVGTCQAPEDAPVFWTSETGTLSATVPAVQRFETFFRKPRYCRDNCQIALWDNGIIEYVLDYEMAEGSLSAAPATGLVDGQAVAVTGSQLMASYHGPMVWFVPTGAWSLVQCGRDVLDDQTLLGVFTHCAYPPPGGPVSVPGSDLSTTVDVKAELTSILGEPVDCTAASEACVLLLARMEQDQSMSFHSAPLSFAS